MQFLLLLVLALVCSWQSWPHPAGDLPLPAYGLLAWLPVVAVVLASRGMARWVRRNLLLEPARREAVLRRYGAFRVWHIFALIAAYLLTLYGLGWGWVVEQLCSFGMPPVLMPGAELILLAPFLAGLTLSWAAFYDAEWAIHETSVPLFARPFWSRGSYVLFHARQNLALIVAPLTMLIGAKGLLRQFPALYNDDYFLIGGFAVLVGVFLCMPWVLRFVLGLTPLPAGPLRDRLTATARRLNFRCSDILLWNTYGGVANAMVIGVLPRPRYVVLSDRLIAGLNEDEVEAVFGHEVGHVRHRHMLYYLGFLFMSLVVLDLVLKLLNNFAASHFPGMAPVLHPNSELAALPYVPLLVLYIFVVFGFLSRRCERQADIYGCRAVSCGESDCCPGHVAEAPLCGGARGLCPTGIRTFVSALEKVAHLNGISRSKPGWLQSWQHSTIARRVEFLQSMLADPALEPRFQRQVGQVKWALIAVLCVLLVALSVAQS